MVIYSIMKRLLLVDDILFDVFFLFLDTHNNGVSLGWSMTNCLNKCIRMGNHHVQGLVNVPIEHHPTIGDIISDRYLKVMFKIPNSRDIYQPLIFEW